MGRIHTGIRAYWRALGERRRHQRRCGAPPPPRPIGRHLLYPSAANRGTPDGCGSIGLGKEESSGIGQACG